MYHNSNASTVAVAATVLCTTGIMIIGDEGPRGPGPGPGAARATTGEGAAGRHNHSVITLSVRELERGKHVFVARDFGVSNPHTLSIFITPPHPEIRFCRVDARIRCFLFFRFSCKHKTRKCHLYGGVAFGMPFGSTTDDVTPSYPLLSDLLVLCLCSCACIDVLMPTTDVLGTLVTCVRLPPIAFPRFSILLNFKTGQPSFTYQQAGGGRMIAQGVSF